MPGPLHFSQLPKSMSVSCCKYWSTHSRVRTVVCSIRRQAKLDFSFMNYLARVFLLSMLGTMCSTVTLRNSRGGLVLTWVRVSPSEPQPQGMGLKVKCASSQSSWSHRKTQLPFLLKCLCCTALHPNHWGLENISSAVQPLGCSIFSACL